MRIDFDNNSGFIDIKIGSPGNIAIVLGAQDKNDSGKMQVNAAEVSLQEFSNLVNSLKIELPPPNKE